MFWHPEVSSRLAWGNAHCIDPLQTVRNLEGLLWWLLWPIHSSFSLVSLKDLILQRGTISPGKNTLMFPTISLASARASHGIGSGVVWAFLWRHLEIKCSSWRSYSIMCSVSGSLPRFFEIKALPVISKRNQAAAWMEFALLVMAGSLRIWFLLCQQFMDGYSCHWWRSEWNSVLPAGPLLELLEAFYTWRSSVWVSIAK